MKKLIFIFLIFITKMSFSQTYELIIPDERIKISKVPAGTFYYLNSKKNLDDGKYIAYYDKSKKHKVFEINILNGKNFGKSIYWYKNGNIESISFSHEFSFDSIEKEKNYYKNGNLQWENIIIDSNYYKSINYSKNKRIKEVNYHTIYKDKEGKASIWTYTEKYYKNGQLEYKGNVNSLDKQTDTIYYKNGKIQKITTHDKACTYNNYFEFYKNGNKKITGAYINLDSLYDEEILFNFFGYSPKIGDWKYYNKNGRLIKTETNEDRINFYKNKISSNSDSSDYYKNKLFLAYFFEGKKDSAFKYLVDDDKYLFYYYTKDYKKFVKLCDTMLFEVDSYEYTDEWIESKYFDTASYNSYYSANFDILNFATYNSAKKDTSNYNLRYYSFPNKAGEICYLKANAFVELGEYKKAIQDYTVSIKIISEIELHGIEYYPTYFEQTADYLYLKRGIAYMKNGEKDKALNDFYMAKKYGSKEAENYINELLKK